MTSPEQISLIDAWEVSVNKQNFAYVSETKKKNDEQTGQTNKTERKLNKKILD